MARNGHRITKIKENEKNKKEDFLRIITDAGAIGIKLDRKLKKNSELFVRKV